MDSFLSQFHKKKFRVLRTDHEIFRKNFQEWIDKVDISLLCELIQRNGGYDGTRDNKSIPALRVDVGFSNHNYEKDHSKKASSSLLRPQPKLCGIEAIQEYPDQRILAKLLDSMQAALDDTYRNYLNLDPPMKNEYIRCHFAEPMR